MLRSRALARAGVSVRTGATVRGLVASGDRVTGVRLSDGTELAADLVLDTSGRKTSSAKWLEEAGLPVPADDQGAQLRALWETHAPGASAGDAGLAAVSDQHFERSKLVVLGLATKDARQADWDYERELAGTLLSDTRLYRAAAEERGMQSLAGVMRDLELVLLQTSMSEQRDAASLGQLQRLIRRRDLITKMEIVHAGRGGR